MNLPSQALFVLLLAYPRKLSGRRKYSQNPSDGITWNQLTENPYEVSS
jgi:hypothetical protein